MSLSSGSYIVSQPTLVGLTGDCYCCCYILMQLFSAPVLENVYLLLDKSQTMQTSWNSTISCENYFIQILSL